jgi:hypothetical protein
VGKSVAVVDLDLEHAGKGIALVVAVVGANLVELIAVVGMRRELGVGSERIVVVVEEERVGVVVIARKVVAPVGVVVAARN